MESYQGLGIAGGCPRKIPEEWISRAGRKVLTMHCGMHDLYEIFSTQKESPLSLELTLAYFHSGVEGISYCLPIKDLYTTYLFSRQRMNKNAIIIRRVSILIACSIVEDKYLRLPRFKQRYEKTDANDSEGHQISYDPVKERLQKELTCFS